jgi:hypothetical protein
MAGLRVRWIAAIGALALLLVAVSAARAQETACAPAEVRMSAPLSGSDKRKFEQEFRRAVTLVCKWWGKTYDGPFRVNVEDSRGPSMALVPAWRGNRGDMLFRARVIREGYNATVHEVVHVFAPNANRFLAEGLAVYAHQHLGGGSAYPNFGEDLHRAARKFADADVATLERIETPRRLQSGTLSNDDAYIVAGSFVRFLIETHGMDKFRALYALTPLVPNQRNPGDVGRWQKIYGVPLERLIADWRAVVAK